MILIAPDVKHPGSWLPGEQRDDRPKIVQGILRHGKIQTTLDLYTQEDSDETPRGAGRIS